MGHPVLEYTVPQKHVINMLKNTALLCLGFSTLIHHASAVARTECTKSGNFEKIQSDVSLTNHVIATYKVSSRIDCVTECLAAEQCASYNFQETPISGQNECELNSKTRASAGVELQARPGYSYYESKPEDATAAPCLSSPCQNGGYCMSGCRNTFVCQCPAGRTGHYCERWADDAHNFTLVFPTKSTLKYAFSNNVTDTAAFTLCLWLRTTAAGPMTLASYTNVANNRELALSYKGNGETQLELNGVTESMYSAPLNDGKWHHVCITWQNTDGAWTFFVDGLRRISGKLAENHVLKGNGHFVIGQSKLSYGGSLDPSESFVGEISQLNFWGSVLEMSTVASMVKNNSILAGDAIDWRNVQAHVIGDTLIRTPSEQLGYDLFLVNLPTGNISNYVESTITQPLTAVTVVMWVKVPDAVQTGLFTYTAGASSLGCAYNSKRRFRININGDLGLEDVDPFMDNSWHHFCLTWRGDTGQTRLFFDGSLRIDLKGVLIGGTIEANGVFKLGQFEEYAFLGSMTGVNLWNTALSGFVVSALSKGSGFEAGSVVAWDALKNAVSHGSAVFQPTNYIESKVPSAEYTLYWNGRSVDTAKFTRRAIPDMTEMTLCFWFNLYSYPGGLYHYYSSSYKAALQGYIHTYTSYYVYINDAAVSITFPTSSSYAWNHVCYSWSNHKGDFEFYYQGEMISSSTDFQKGETVDGNGIFLLGQDMDTFGGSFDSSQSYYGRLNHLNLWSTGSIRANVMTAMARGSSAFEGDIINWSDFRNSVTGGAVIVEERSPCIHPSYTSQFRRNEYCWKLRSSGPGDHYAIFDRDVGDDGKQWRCYTAAACVKLDPQGLPMYDATTGSPSYYTKNGDLVNTRDLPLP